MIEVTPRGLGPNRGPEYAQVDVSLRTGREQDIAEHFQPTYCLHLS